MSASRKSATADEIRRAVLYALTLRGVPQHQRDQLSLTIERKPRSRRSQCNWTFAVDDGPLPDGLSSSTFAAAVTMVQLDYDLAAD